MRVYWEYKYRNTAVMKTPMQELIRRLDDLYDRNPERGDYRAGLFEALTEARRSLQGEADHIKNAWREGQSGVRHQTATEYYLETYGKRY